MGTAVTRSGVGPAYIERGRVLDVDMATYTLSVDTEFSKKPQTGISFAVPYMHHYNGEGINFMPEVGSICWICFPSDGNRPFVLAWAGIGDEGDFRARRRDMNPGDICLSTRDDNFVMLRRGGVVQISSTPLCQRIFMPINNTIKDFCENYGLHALGGDLEWSIAREEKTTDGKRPALLKLYAREFANDPKPIAALEIGSHDGDQKTILSLIIKDSGQDGAANKFSLKIDKDGNVTWVAEKDVSMTVKGNLTVKVEGDTSWKNTGNISVEAKKIQAKSDSTIELTAQSKAAISAPTTTVSDTLMVAGGSSAVVLYTGILPWMTGHTHPVPTLGGAPTGPSSMPPPPSMISKKTFSD